MDVDANSGLFFRDGQLSCIGQDWSEIPEAVAETYGDHTRRLDMSFNSLRSLAYLEMFTHIEELILDNNDLSDNIQLPNVTHLQTLTINKNKITDLDKLLECLAKQCPSLTYLSLLGNEACPNQLSSLDKDEEDYQRYRHYVLYKLPTLKFLDSTPVRKSEREEAQKHGKFLRVVRPTSEDKGAENTSSAEMYSPLPPTVREDPAASFGKCKYVYYGRHSEGNRFIKNNDL